jgi:hypothetical protein
MVLPNWSKIENTISSFSGEVSFVEIHVMDCLIAMAVLGIALKTEILSPVNSLISLIDNPVTTDMIICSPVISCDISFSTPVA